MKVSPGQNKRTGGPDFALVWHKPSLKCNRVYCSYEFLIEEGAEEGLKFSMGS